MPCIMPLLYGPRLVFCDKAECLDGFAAKATDDMIDLMRRQLAMLTGA